MLMTSQPGGQGHLALVSPCDFLLLSKLLVTAEARGPAEPNSPPVTAPGCNQDPPACSHSRASAPRPPAASQEDLIATAGVNAALSVFTWSAFHKIKFTNSKLVFLKRSYLS